MKNLFKDWTGFDTMLALLILSMFSYFLGVFIIDSNVQKQKIQACEEIAKTVADFEDCLDD